MAQEATAADERRWRSWFLIVGTLSTPGTCLGIMAWGVLPLVLILVLALLVGVFGVHLDRVAGRPWWRCLTKALECGICLTLLVLGWMALLFVSPALAMMAAVAALATMPPVRRRWTGRGSSTGSCDVAAAPAPVERPQPGGAPQPPTPTVRNLSNLELCTVWRRSFLLLQETAAVQDKLAVVVLRQRCLDEMEHRNTVAFEAWLASGARAAGDPTRFLGGGREAA